jgi:RNA polymerase sigma-70 factor (ECF subfamily)
VTCWIPWELPDPPGGGPGVGYPLPRKRAGRRGADARAAGWRRRPERPSTLSRRRWSRQSARRMDIGALYRQESGRVLATLIGMVGDFDLAEEAVQEAFATALERWPVGGAPSERARVARHDRRATARSTACAGALASRNRAVIREAFRRRVTLPCRSRSRARGRARRPAAPDLHLLSSRARDRGAGRADAAHAVRALDTRRSRARSSSRSRRWPAARAREAEDPRRADPLPRAGADGLPERLDAVSARRLPRSSPRATPRPPARRWSGASCARRRSARAAARGSDAAAPEPIGLLALMLLHDSRREARVSADGRPRAARGAGPWHLGRGGDPRGSGARREALRARRARASTRCRPRSPRSTPRPRARRGYRLEADRHLYDVLLRVHPRRSSS